MARIAVQPEELQSISTEFAQARGSLEELVSRATSVVGALDWATRSAIAVDERVSVVRSQAGGLIEQVQSLARYLQLKAEAFADADRAGAGDIAAVSERASGWLAQMTPLSDGHQGALADVEPWMLAGSLLAPLVLPIASGLPWLGGLQAIPLTPAPVPNPNPDPGMPTAPVPNPDPDPGMTAPVLPTPAPAAPAPEVALEVPAYSQQTGPWADLTCRPETFATQGCLLTSIGMLVKYNKPDVSVDRDFMVHLRDGMCNEDHNVIWASPYLDKYGLTMKQHEVKGETDMMQQVFANLHSQPPKPTIIGMYKSPNMHWLPITGYRGDGTNLKPEDFTINDPYTTHGWSTLDQFLNADNYSGGAMQQLVTITPAG